MKITELSLSTFFFFFLHLNTSAGSVAIWEFIELCGISFAPGHNLLICLSVLGKKTEKKKSDEVKTSSKPLVFDP